MADLSKLSTEELMKMRDAPPAVDLSSMSTEELMKMRGAEDGKKSGIYDTLKNIGMGAVKGASDIGTTIMRPLDATGLTGRTNKERKASLGQFFGENADTSSIAFKGGELTADIAGTAGIGGVLAKGVTAGATALPALAKFAPKLATALQSGGFSLGGATAATGAGRAADMALRVGAGATVGGASAGLVNPDDAATGAVIGGALPVAAKVAGMAGKALSKDIAPEVRTLYEKAKNLGIDIPADRLANSKPLNAVASSLNYIPMSGRAATEEKLYSQLNRAVSKTFGQDSDNVTAALRKAQTALGDKFEVTLKSNMLSVDDELLNELAGHMERATKQLSPNDAKIIGNQVDEILTKAGAGGKIDGQAAYNIKKDLDAIGRRNSNEAYYARDLKKSLMSALNRSLGTDEAAAFAKTRQQYGNMLELENLAQNGAEGGISVARLANMKGINNQELQDIADIAAQFGRVRESPHGAMQRVMVGTVAGPAAFSTGTLPVLAGAVAGGRATNAALNSNTLKNMMLNRGAMGDKLNKVGSNATVRSLLYGMPNQASP